MTQKTKNARSPCILHCDMNNFYASVECMLNPDLKKYAIAVGGSVEERRGIVLAKNDKAKAFGVKTAEALWQARNKCRDLVVVPPHYEQYLKFSRLARAIYERYTDQVEAYGMDECWLDVSGSGLYGSGIEIAEEIRNTIKKELGLTVSIGVSFNKIFAKLGSDMKKPDAITVIDKEGFQQKVWPLAVNELLGVGQATNKKMRQYGIFTIGDLATTDEKFLKSAFGIHGVRLKQYANGEDRSAVAKSDAVSPIKSIGHGITTVQDLENSAEVWRVLLALVQDVGAKLRKHEKKAGGVSISVRNTKLESKEWQQQIPLPTQNAMTLAKSAFDLFDKNYRWHLPIRSVTVRAIQLTESSTPIQCDFFMNFVDIERQEKLDTAVDSIRRRFGKEAIQHAVLFQGNKLPPKLDNGVLLPSGMLG